MILNPFSSVIQQDYSRTIKTRTLSKKHFSGESESVSCAIPEGANEDETRLPFRTRSFHIFVYDLWDYTSKVEK